jgi:hypothetical protein
MRLSSPPVELQPLGSVVPAYKNLVAQHQQVAAAQRRRADRAEAAFRRLAAEVVWAILLAIVLTAGVTWAIAGFLLRMS